MSDNIVPSLYDSCLGLCAINGLPVDTIISKSLRDAIKQVDVDGNFKYELTLKSPVAFKHMTEIDEYFCIKDDEYGNYHLINLANPGLPLWTRDSYLYFWTTSKVYTPFGEQDAIDKMIIYTSSWQSFQEIQNLLADLSIILFQWPLAVTDIALIEVIQTFTIGNHKHEVRSNVNHDEVCVTRTYETIDDEIARIQEL